MAQSHSSQSASPATPSVRRRAQLSSVFPVLVAITADSAANAAIHITRALAQECGAVPTVLHVVHKDLAPSACAMGAMGNIPEAALNSACRNRQLLALEDQVQKTLGTLPAWRYDVEVGATVPTIVQRTHELRAELVILGLPQHNFLRRAFVRDTVLGIAENTQSAALAVRPELNHRPELIMVAVDFGIASLRAAHLACQLVAPGGRIILVYVEADPRPDIGADSTYLTPDGTSAPETALAFLIEELSSRKTVTITSVIEHGSSIHGVKEAALRMHPEVIALGARHHSAVDWFFGDSVSTELVSERQWSLLVVPE